ncbi:hypothetical protein [Acidovorax temperans]|uniref:hypothetical protein n=1 Tax=Acidovorax temperans TaxID=80878 RepID=UPI001A951AB5|nr:hypothetical protein [Acidovorax temperans]MBO0943234.1 hypothetical protein [Acidovorax temperans]WCT26283.1 hypothetical protein PQV96_09925 [Acidovorax temperans]
MSTLYAHGPQQCRLCFDGHAATLSLGEWRLHNNPGYYGSATPSTLILGFSKGANQNRAAEAGHFDRIAFAGARHRLQAVLVTLGLMPNDRSIDHLMTAHERDFGVASLVRCSFCKMKNGECKTSGDVIPSAFTDADTLAIIERCVATHLKTLPPSVKRVVLLGTADAYIKKTRTIFGRLYSNYTQVNEAAFRAGDALWVYAAHPSPGNGHFESWISGPPENVSARKRLLAQLALADA